MPNNLKVIPVRLESELYERVIEQAKAENRSRSNFVESLVKKAMAKKKLKS